MSIASVEEVLIAGSQYLSYEEEEDEEEDEDEKEPEAVVVSYACEDCDYRWEVTYDDEDTAYEAKQYCPMCGSANSTQI